MTSFQNGRKGTAKITIYGRHNLDHIGKEGRLKDLKNWVTSFMNCLILQLAVRGLCTGNYSKFCLEGGLLLP